MSVQTKRDCSKLLEDFVMQASAIQALRAETTEERITSIHAQGKYDRTWPIPFRDTREGLRDKIAKAEKAVGANETQLEKMQRELAHTGKQMKGCQFTGVASKRAWSFFGGN